MILCCSRRLCCSEDCTHNAIVCPQHFATSQGDSSNGYHHKSNEQWNCTRLFLSFCLVYLGQATLKLISMCVVFQISGWTVGFACHPLVASKVRLIVVVDAFLIANVFLSLFFHFAWHTALQHIAVDVTMALVEPPRYCKTHHDGWYSSWWAVGYSSCWILHQGSWSLHLDKASTCASDDDNHSKYSKFNVAN